LDFETDDRGPACDHCKDPLVLDDIVVLAMLDHSTAQARQEDSPDLDLFAELGELAKPDNLGGLLKLPVGREDNPDFDQTAELGKRWELDSLDFSLKEPVRQEDKSCSVVAEGSRAEEAEDESGHETRFDSQIHVWPGERAAPTIYGRQ